MAFFPIVAYRDDGENGEGSCRNGPFFESVEDYIVRSQVTEQQMPLSEPNLFCLLKVPSHVGEVLRMAYAAGYGLGLGDVGPQL